MMATHNRRIFVANGEIEAQQVQAFLGSAGIASQARGETLRKTHGLSLDGLGAVEIFVEEADEREALELLASAEEGKFRLKKGSSF